MQHCSIPKELAVCGNKQKRQKTKNKMRYAIWEKSKANNSYVELL